MPDQDRRPPITSVLTLYLEKLERGMRLWQRWFDEDGDPWENVQGWSECFFCGEFDPGHKPDCIYVEARELVGFSLPVVK